MHGTSAGSSVPEGHVVIIPRVEAPGGEVPIEMAGAGAWEGLVLSTLGARVAGRVVAFDEVATNLHPTRQARLLEHLRQLDQAILVTHSPFLVPRRTPKDLLRVSRLYRGPHGTEVARVDSPSEPPDGWLARWRQLIATSTDVRAALFVEGVVLVEGDADEGAFRRWFDDPAVTSGLERTIDALNVSVLSVDGDKNFGVNVSLFERLHVPWVILCDGPVMSPEYERSLVQQLEEAGITLEGRPSGTEKHEFDAWKSYWRQHRVYTVADCFGGVTNKNDKSGEIEAFLNRVDEALWSKVRGERASKVRAAYAFAEELDLRSHPPTLKLLQDLWNEVQEGLGLWSGERRDESEPKRMAILDASS